MIITKVILKKLETEGKMRALASITFDNEFVVTGIKVMEGAKGLFIAMPSRKTPDGEFKDICFPVTKESREHIANAVLSEYGGKLEPVGEIPNCPDCGLPVEQCTCLPF
jgi:stage V sporulation protein G